MATQPAVRLATLILFRVERGCFALPLHAVDHILWMVELLPLPAAPGAICGLLNYHEQIVPVADLRRRMGWMQRPYGPTDRLILIKGGPRPLALAADSVDEVVEVEVDRMETATGLVPAIPGLQSLTTLNGEVILIQDPASWLTADEESFLQHTLEHETGR
jgi:purine-binding chemotaxis protein CheW